MPPATEPPAFRRGCLRDDVDDPATFELIDASPFIIAGLGPFGPRLKEALREALTETAGD